MLTIQAWEVAQPSNWSQAWTTGSGYELLNGWTNDQGWMDLAMDSG